MCLCERMCTVCMYIYICVCKCACVCKCVCVCVGGGSGEMRAYVEICLLSVVLSGLDSQGYQLSVCDARSWGVRLPGRGKKKTKKKKHQRWIFSQRPCKREIFSQRPCKRDVSNLI